jgi:hypothetical protein
MLIRTVEAAAGIVKARMGFEGQIYRGGALFNSSRVFPIITKDFFSRIAST